MTKIALVVGSIRADSYNHTLAKNIEQTAPEGVTFEYVDIASLPLFNQDDEVSFPATASALKAIVDDADGVLFVTPEYNHSFTGVLKNAIDWGSRPWGNNSWGGKPTGVIGASISPNGAKFAQDALAGIVDYFVSPRYQAENISLVVDETTFGEDGRLSGETLDQVTAYITGFAAWVEAENARTQREADLVAQAQPVA